LFDLLDSELKTKETDEKSAKKVNWALASSVLIGDFFHNFTDGVLVGTAFSLCHRELAVAISAATVYHELAQEVADFFLLTKHCNLKVPLALVLNFVSGLSVLLGAVIILSFDVTTNTTGCILAIGSGVYIYIAAAECLPRARKAQKTTGDKFISVGSFICGVIPIGLVLLNHGHCEA
jgi:zinc transporter ZupT